jgi:hypothetical protein
MRGDDRPAFRGILFSELKADAEFAPVIITVSANAAPGATAQVPASAAAKTVSDPRIFANIMFPSDIRRMPLRRRVG